jgi:hypothetical protein
MNLRVDCPEQSPSAMRNTRPPRISYRHSIQPPLGRLLAQAPPLHRPAQWHDSFGDNIKIVLRLSSRELLHMISCQTGVPGAKYTSIVSRTLITPGCRNVLDLRTAFFARGRRDLFALMSNAKTLQAEPSSYTSHDIVSR